MSSKKQIKMLKKHLQEARKEALILTIQNDSLRLQLKLAKCK